MRVMKNISLVVLFSLSLAGQDCKAQSAKLADFESLTVASTSTKSWNTAITIMFDGSYDYNFRRMGRKGEDYATNYRLKSEHLRQLEALLRATDWLTKPGAVNDIRIRDAMKYTMVIVRDGRETTIVCCGKQPS